MRHATWMGIGLMAVALVSGCQTTPTQQGAVLGGALGAGLGTIIGHQSGQQLEGALIGAGAGAVAGALIGDQVDERRSPAPQTAYVVEQRPVVREYRAVERQPVRGHYETRIVKSPGGETYEERVWVPHR